MLTRTLVMITDRNLDLEAFAPEDGDDRVVAAPRSLLSHLNNVLSYAPSALEDVNVAEFDTLFIPDGLGNPERGTFAVSAVDAVSHFLDARKPIDLVCEGQKLTYSKRSA